VYTEAHTPTHTLTLTLTHSHTHTRTHTQGHKHQGFVRLRVSVVIHDDTEDDKPDLNAMKSLCK
jgi:hypothetical protein